MIRKILVIAALLVLSSQMEMRNNAESHMLRNGESHQWGWKSITDFFSPKKNETETPPSPPVGCPANSTLPDARYTTWIKICSLSEDKGEKNPNSTYGLGKSCRCYMYCNPVNNATVTQEVSKGNYCYTTDDTATCLDACATKLTCLKDSVCSKYIGGL